MYIYFSQLGDTPIDIAIRYRRHEVVDVLLKSGVNINIDAKVSYHVVTL